MAVDMYTKVVLTIIAVSLTVIAFDRTDRPANAQTSNCGDWNNPCYVVGVHPKNSWDELNSGKFRDGMWAIQR